MTGRKCVARVGLAGALVVAMASIAGSSPAGACSCAEVAFSEVAADTVAAFVGTQTERIVHDETAENGAELVFAVDIVFAGDVTTPFSVRTHAQGSACGLDFSRVAATAVAAFEYRGDPSVSLCSPDVTAAQLEAEFGAGHEPVAAAGRSGGSDSSDGTTRTIALAAFVGASLLALGGGALAARRRRA